MKQWAVSIAKLKSLLKQSDEYLLKSSRNTKTA